MRTNSQVEAYDDIVSNSSIRALVQLAGFGATAESLTREIIDRVMKLQSYPAYARMTKLNELWSFARNYMDYDDSSLARSVINAELLELSCLSTFQRALAMQRLAEALRLDEPDMAYQLWQDCAAFANLHGHELIAATAMRHLERAR